MTDLLHSALLGRDGLPGIVSARLHPLNLEAPAVGRAPPSWLEVLGVQLLCGSDLRSTRVTSGRAAGDLLQLFRVLERRAEDAGGTRVRAPELELDPSGLLVVSGRGLVLTAEGLGLIDGFLTCGGYPGTGQDAAAQAGRVPLGAHAHGRFNDLGWLADLAAFLSMPIRFARGAFAPEPERTVTEATNRGNGTSEDSPSQATRTVSTDATGRPDGTNTVEVWGRLIPYDEDKRTHLPSEDFGTDPERYQKRARWAPHFLLDLDKLIGDEDPKKKRKKKEKDPDEDLVEPPPPGGGGGAKPDPQEQRKLAAFARSDGANAAAFQVPYAATALPTREGIDVGDGETTISAIKDGISRRNGGEEDQDDEGVALPPAGGSDPGGVPDGGVPGPPVAGTPKPPVECPAGNRRKPVVVVEDYTSKRGERRRRTTVDGRIVSDVLIDAFDSGTGRGGVLGPGAAGANPPRIL